MKFCILTIALLFAFIVGKAQNNIPVTIARNLNATVLVDSVVVDNGELSRIDPMQIESITVEKNSKYLGGAIYITLKDHRLLKTLKKEVWLPLKQVTDEKIAEEDKAKTRLYILDGQLITDTTNVKIQPSRYHNVYIKPASETPYFKTALPDVLLIIISTIDPGNTIRIRGAERD